MKEPQYSQYNSGNTSGSDSDKLLDLVLKTDDMNPLPDDFADRIALKAVRKIRFRQSITEFFVYASVIVTVGLIFSGIFYFTNPESWTRWQSFFLSKIYILSGISLILLFILFSDLVFFPWLFFPKSNKLRGHNS